MKKLLKGFMRKCNNKKVIMIRKKNIYKNMIRQMKEKEAIKCKHERKNVLSKKKKKMMQSQHGLV